MFYLNYLLKEKGLYKVTFKNNFYTYMEKKAFIDKSNYGQKRIIGLLFELPYEDFEELNSICSDYKQKTLVKSISKMELVISYDRFKHNTNLIEEHSNYLMKYFEKTAEMENYSVRYNDEITPVNKAFNKWINDPEVLDNFYHWYDTVFGFSDSEVEEPLEQLYKAFKAGYNSKEE